MSASKKTPSKNFNRLKQSLSSTARIQNDRLLYGKTGVSTEGILWWLIQAWIQIESQNFEIFIICKSKKKYK